MRKARMASRILRASVAWLDEQEVLGDLLGQPRRALRPLAGIGDVGDHRAHHADEVDAGMGEEALVLGGDEGLQDALGHGGHRHEHALLARILGQQAAVGGIEARGDRRLVVGELLVVGQAMAEVPEQACHCASANDQSGRRKGQQDFEKVQHFHFFTRPTLGAATASLKESYAFLVAIPAPKCASTEARSARGQGNLVLPHRQKLLVLWIGQVAELDQGGRDFGRGQHGEARLAVGARQQAHAAPAEGAARWSRPGAANRSPCRAGSWRPGSARHCPAGRPSRMPATTPSARFSRAASAAASRSLASSDSV